MHSKVIFLTALSSLVVSVLSKSPPLFQYNSNRNKRHGVNPNPFAISETFDYRSSGGELTDFGSGGMSDFGSFSETPGQNPWIVGNPAIQRFEVNPSHYEPSFGGNLYKNSGTGSQFSDSFYAGLDRNNRFGSSGSRYPSGPSGFNSKFLLSKINEGNRFGQMTDRRRLGQSKLNEKIHTGPTASPKFHFKVGKHSSYGRGSSSSSFSAQTKPLTPMVHSYTKGNGKSMKYRKH